MRIPWNDRCLAYAAMTGDTRNTDSGLFTKPSRLPKAARCDNNSKIGKWKWGAKGKYLTVCEVPATGACHGPLTTPLKMVFFGNRLPGMRLRGPLVDPNFLAKRSVPTGVAYPEIIRDDRTPGSHRNSHRAQPGGAMDEALLCRCRCGRKGWRGACTPPGRRQCVSLVGGPVA
jgi:hypothetical protein